MRFTHGGNIFYYSKYFNLSEEKIYDFSVNLNPLYFPDNLKESISANIDKLYYYPEIYADTLKEKIASKYNCSTEQIIIGNGSTQLIYLIPLALKIKKAVIIQPSFSEYERALKRVDASVVNFKLSEKKDFTLDIDKLIKFLDKIDYNALFLCNPSNPVGNLLGNDKLTALAKFLRKNNKFFIIDEAFIDFTDSKSMIDKNINKCIILRSLTKIFGIAGLRLGFLKTDIRTAKKLKANIEPWSNNTLSLIAGEKLLNSETFIRKSKNFIKDERVFITEEISAISELKVFTSCTNYLLIKILTNNSVDNLERFLLKYNILIRNCSNFRGLNNKFFRIGLKNREANKILIDKIKEFLGRG